MPLTSPNLQGARRSALLTLGSQGPGGAAAASSAGLSSVHYCPAGSPYTLVASGRAGGSGGGCVHLWDARRGTAAVAHLVTPGRSALQSGVELSPDGVLVMAVSQPNQVGVRWGGWATSEQLVVRSVLIVLVLIR